MFLAHESIGSSLTKFHLNSARMVSYLILYTVITYLPLTNSAKFQLIQVLCPCSSLNEQYVRTYHAAFVFFFV